MLQIALRVGSVFPRSAASALSVVRLTLATWVSSRPSSSGVTWDSQWIDMLGCIFGGTEIHTLRQQMLTHRIPPRTLHRYKNDGFFGRRSTFDVKAFRWHISWSVRTALCSRWSRGSWKAFLSTSQVAHREIFVRLLPQFRLLYASLLLGTILSCCKCARLRTCSSRSIREHL